MSALEESKTTEAPIEATSSKTLEDDDIILPDIETTDPSEEPLPLPPNKPWIKEWMTDMRLEWLRQKVSIGLNIPRSTFNTVVQTEEGSNQLRSFLDGSSSSLLFYLDEMVTTIETIVEPRPPPPPPPPLPPEDATPKDKQEGQEENAKDDASKTKDDAKGKKGKDKKKDKKGDKKGEKKGDKKDDKKGKKGGKKGKEEPTSESDQNAGKVEGGKTEGDEGEGSEGNEGGDVSKGPNKVEEPPKPHIVYTQKRAPILCASVGFLPEHALSANVAYFLKMNVADTSGITEEQLSQEVEFGVLPGGPGMSALEKLMAQLFVPMLAREAVRDESQFWNTKQSNMMENIGNELLTNMQRFTSQVSSARARQEGNFQLVIPNIPVDSVEKHDIDYELILHLESALSDWVLALRAALQKESQRIVVGKGPLAELEFWHARNDFLSSMYEQLNSNKAKRVLAVLEAGSSNSNLLGSFKLQVAELGKTYIEAKDNVKILTTIERHFKTLQEGTLGGVLETINPMINALRMVWVISRYYAEDANMGGLFERIAYQAVMDSLL